VLCNLGKNPLLTSIRRTHDEKPVTQAEDTVVSGDRPFVGDFVALLAEL
jgi:hypothetical protein